MGHPFRSRPPSKKHLNFYTYQAALANHVPGLQHPNMYDADAVFGGSEAAAAATANQQVGKVQNKFVYCENLFITKSYFFDGGLCPLY